MRRIEGLPANVSIESLSLRDDAYAVLCLICGGGGAPATVETCRGEDAKAGAWSVAVGHDAEHDRRREELENGERRRQQAAALNWSAAQADAMLWADRDWLHFDGRVFYRKDMSDPGVGRGRTVARARVEALVTAGFLRVKGQSVELTRDGHDARRAWIAAGEPAAQESRTLRPLMFGEEEARQDAERAAYLATARAKQAEREAIASRFAPEPEPAPAADPAGCDHERHVWLYLTADRITGQLGYHLTCACTKERNAYPGNSPAMATGTATRPLGIRDAATEVALWHADRCGYSVTGRWEVLDEHTKRAAVEPADEPMWPVAADANRRTEPTPTAAADQAQQPAAEQPAPAISVTAALVTETGEDEDQDDDGPCNHAETRWLYIAAEQPTRQLRAYLTCACDRGPKLGNFNQRTATLPAGRSVEAAQTRTAQALADRNNYEVTGPWEVLDDDTKRAPVRWTLAAVPAAAPAAEVVTAERVTKTAGPVAAAVDPAEAYAAWIDRQAERAGRLAVDGPGIIGPGTQITYRDGRGPGMRSKHSTSGSVVRIGRTSVAWRPYGAARVLRTPLDDMRVTVPRTGAVVEGSGRTAGWRRWSLAEHLAYARRSSTPAPESVDAVSAAESAPQAPTRPDARPATAEAVQLPLWPAPVASHPAAAADAGSVVVIPCSGAKLDRPAPAGELYRGSLHTMCRRAADTLTAEGGTVVVLSARWGLVPLAQVIDPYELRMGEPGSITADELRAQAARLGIDRAADVTVLAGAAYTAAARSVWSHAAAPLAGSRGIGEMRQRLAQLAGTGRRQTA